MAKLGPVWSPEKIMFAISMCIVGSCLASLSQQNDPVMRVPRYRGNDRPPHTEYAARARYMVHRANWVVINTVSTQPGMEGYAFGNIISLSDGLPDNSTGIPYVYVSPLDVSYKDIQVQNKVTMTFSEAEFSDIDDCKVSPGGDPESPLCARLVLLGSVANITDAAELEFAKKVLFTRHPLMTSWPVGHLFRCMKMVINDLWIIDYFGGGVHIDVDEYFHAKPTH